MSQGKRSGGQSPPAERNDKRPRLEEAAPRPSGSATNGKSTIQEQIQAAKARAAALMAKNASIVRPPPLQHGNSVTQRDAASTSATPFASAPLSIQQRLAEAKKKTEGLLQSQQQRQSNIERSGIHPLLRKQEPSTSRGAASSLSAGAESSLRPNPYLSSVDDQDVDANAAQNKPRRRALQFNTPGRHIRAAEEARREAQFEALKKRIEEQSRKAGLQQISAEERALRKTAPPDIEWWDQAFFPGKNSYDVGKDLDVLLQSKDSPLDRYIQHPIPIPAPMDKIAVEAKGVMLTKKEQKKMRRMRRKAELEDKQDRIKMGLLPPDPPKVKLSNMMRVLGSEAIADPTKVEARIRREMAARKNKHDQMNQERKLTTEQKHEKIEAKKQKDLQAGIHTLVFKVKHLVSPSHKFKVRKNALQLGLTGMTLFGKDYAVVIVEGGQKAMKAYRHLIVSRIDWKSPGQPKDHNEDGTSGTPASSSSQQVQTSYDDLSYIDWQENYSRILFEGPIRERHFTVGFRAYACETDFDAKDHLGSNLSSYWDLAKRDERIQEDGLD